MDRLACVDLPELPLQILLDRHPEWKGLPAAVVAQDRPQAKILWVSPEARSAGISVGMRYAQGLSLEPKLQAAQVTPRELQEELNRLTELLRSFSPEVEVAKEPGVFWLGAGGLGSLFLSASAWARQIQGALGAMGRRGSVVVGFSRFRTYGIARHTNGIRVLRTPQEEDVLFKAVPLKKLSLEPELRDTLERLGILTVGDFLKLPAHGIRRRFGQEAADLYESASGTRHESLVPSPHEEPVGCVVFLEEPLSDTVPLLFLVRRHLHPLLRRLASRGEALGELEIRWFMGRDGERTDLIRPARPNLQESLILDLVRIKLEAFPLPSSVEEMHLRVHGSSVDPEQLRLFWETSGRDLSAGERALARLRTEFGEESVVRPRLMEGHLPEACFAWEPLEHLRPPKPRPKAGHWNMIRRVYSRPLCLGMRPRHEPDGWLVKDLRSGPVTRIWGPYVISGGWWRKEVHRSYYFLETLRGDIFWVYYDASRKRWFLQGRVE
jgi:protein ImuB